MRLLAGRIVSVFAPSWVSGFDTKLVAAIGDDVLAEPVGASSLNYLEAVSKLSSTDFQSVNSSGSSTGCKPMLRF